MKLVCSNCRRSNSVRRTRVLPGWVATPGEPGQFVIDFRCRACWPAALADTDSRIAAWDPATALGMGRFLEVWAIRDYLPGLAGTSDREAATRLLAQLRESGGSTLTPLVVPAPEAGEPGLVERFAEVVASIPGRTVVGGCLVAGLLAACWIFIAR